MTVDWETAVKQEEAYLRKVHPTTDDIPSCMSLLDGFLLCHVIGSQVKSLYRYGRMSECRDKMEDFKFCMSLKSMEPEAKRGAWIRRRAEWWSHRRVGKSSENVWDIRREPLTNWPPSLSDDAAQPSTVDSHINDTPRFLL